VYEIKKNKEKESGMAIGASMVLSESKEICVVSSSRIGKQN